MQQQPQDSRASISAAACPAKASSRASPADLTKVTIGGVDGRDHSGAPAAVCGHAWPRSWSPLAEMLSGMRSVVAPNGSMRAADRAAGIRAEHGAATELPESVAATDVPRPPIDQIGRSGETHAK